VPAAAVTPALLVYIKVVAVQKLVVGPLRSASVWAYSSRVFICYVFFSHFSFFSFSFGGKREKEMRERGMTGGSGLSGNSPDRVGAILSLPLFL